MEWFVMLWMPVSIGIASENTQESIAMLCLAWKTLELGLHLTCISRFFGVCVRVLQLWNRVLRAWKCCVYIGEGLWITCVERNKRFDPKRFDSDGFSIFLFFWINLANQAPISLCTFSWASRWILGLLEDLKTKPHDLIHLFYILNHFI